MVNDPNEPDDADDPPETPAERDGGDSGKTGGAGTGPGSGQRRLGPQGPAGRGGSGPGSGSGSGSGEGAGFGGLGGGAAPGGPGWGGQGAGGQNPFEALLGAFGGGSSAGGAGFDPNDMAQMMQQLQNAFAMMGGPGGMFGAQAGQSGAESGVNWDITKDTARKTVASLGQDPSPSMADHHRVREAVQLAETWLDEATVFPRSTGVASAWSRAEWVEQTMPTWRRLVEPVAKHIADAMENALSPDDGAADAAGLGQLAGMEQLLRPMLRSSGASMFGLQLGQSLGRLATEVVGGTDIGLPLSADGQVALLPANVAGFGQGLEQSPGDVMLYLALRECARARLFAGAGWLREQILTLVQEYARGITIDTSALEQAVEGLDPANLEELGQKLEGGLFEPRRTTAQEATLTRLETLLALAEGWVDEVVGLATARWMPSAVALAETVRRQRATGGPAEATFATLVGLELRPRRMREAAELWRQLREARGVDGRDATLSHPDVAPATADLDDPAAYVRGGRDANGSGDDFDQALAQLLDEAEGTRREADERTEGHQDDPGDQAGGQPDGESDERGEQR